MNAISRSQTRDSVNAAIARHLEHVRQVVSNWAVDPAGDVEGQLSYRPELRNATACSTGTLGRALLADNAATLPGTSSLDLSKDPSRLQKVSITRTVQAPADNPNLVQIAYVSSGNGQVKTLLSTTLVPPAQGWCS